MVLSTYFYIMIIIHLRGVTWFHEFLSDTSNFQIYIFDP